MQRSQINDVLISKIKDIDWFVNIGHKSMASTTTPLIYVTSLDECIDHRRSVKWSEYRLYARNEISSFLHNHYLDDYKKWNDFAMVAHDLLNSSVLFEIETAAKQQGLDESVVIVARSCVIHAIVEDAYSSILDPLNMCFFRDALEVYRGGNIPCGYVGRKGHGVIEVF